MATGQPCDEAEASKHVELHLLTDCKSVYDHVHREGTPKVPSDKRLAVDLASIRQALIQEARVQWGRRHGDHAEHSPDRPCRPPPHWVPTTEQLADFLTKAMKCDRWLEACAVGLLQLPLKDRARAPN